MRRYSLAYVVLATTRTTLPFRGTVQHTFHISLLPGEPFQADCEMRDLPIPQTDPTRLVVQFHRRTSLHIAS